MSEENKQLTTILFARIVGFNLNHDQSQKKPSNILSQQRHIQQQLIEKHNGKVVKEIGDGILARFANAMDAVDCAITMQMKDHQPVDARVRIGIHTGILDLDENGNAGEDANIALRLQSIADPGGIYVSEQVKTAIDDRNTIPVKFLGEIRLRNVIYGINTYALQGKDLPVPEIKNSITFSGRFWAELHRRNVLRAGAAYVLMSLVIILLIRHGIIMFNFSQGILEILTGILATGLLLALILAWNFERSPNGFIRTTSKDSWRNPYQPAQRKPFTSEFILLGIIIILAVIYFLTK